MRESLRAQLRKARVNKPERGANKPHKRNLLAARPGPDRDQVVAIRTFIPKLNRVSWDKHLIRQRSKRTRYDKKHRGARKCISIIKAQYGSFNRSETRTARLLVVRLRGFLLRVQDQSDLWTLEALLTMRQHLMGWHISQRNRLSPVQGRLYFEAMSYWCDKSILGMLLFALQSSPIGLHYRRTLISELSYCNLPEKPSFNLGPHWYLSCV